jgi:hypothetical protein
LRILSLAVSFLALTQLPALLPRSAKGEGSRRFKGVLSNNTLCVLRIILGVSLSVAIAMYHFSFLLRFEGY